VGRVLLRPGVLPLLIASGDGVLVNTSSVNGFWASLGPGAPNSAYSTAKFAVKGFSEALIEDLRANAPQVRVVVVMPGTSAPTSSRTACMPWPARARADE
jgi:NAD(P)-dependent dehydrogenase (short-subunit alcohol dehydrogenase family)